MNKKQKLQCPCCKFFTIEDDGEEVIVDICPVCYWQYDKTGHENPEIAAGGPNKDMSLKQAQENYKKFNAYHESVKQYVREPLEEEK